MSIGYLWAVTVVVWVGTLLYVFSILRRQARLERELVIMERRLTEATEFGRSLSDSM